MEYKSQLSEAGSIWSWNQSGLSEGFLYIDLFVMKMPEM